jgi:hypothetical protein
MCGNQTEFASSYFETIGRMLVNGSMWFEALDLLYGKGCLKIVRKPLNTQRGAMVRLGRKIKPVA